MSDESNSVPGTGQGTEEVADSAASGRARRLANLRPPFRKGQTGNPRGINGWGKTNEIAAFLESPESIEAGRTRFEALIDSLFQSAIGGNALAAKTLLEYKLGKPGVQRDALAIAEHLRRVDLDRVDIVLRLLGARSSLDPGEVSETLKKCEMDKSGFLLLAEHFLNGADLSEVEKALESQEGRRESIDQGQEVPEEKAES